MNHSDLICKSKTLTTRKKPAVRSIKMGQTMKGQMYSYNKGSNKLLY
jgi:hypothetical protein